MIDVKTGAAMDREVFTYSLQNLYRDLERIEHKRRRRDEAVERLASILAHVSQDHEHNAAS